MANLVSISDARADLAEIVDNVDKTMERVTITVNGQPKAILVSSEELESLEETAEVLSISGAKKAITQGLAEAKKGKGKLLSDL